VQEKIRERMGKVIPLCDRLVYNGIEFTPLEVKFFNDKGPKWWGVLMRHDIKILGEDWIPIKDCIRLPQVHDLNDKKRGLWNWVDWERFVEHSNEDGTIDIHEHYCISNYWHCWKTTPEIALLRALLFQWGIKDEKV
jgi:hypothetical protein